MSKAALVRIAILLACSVRPAAADTAIEPLAIEDCRALAVLLTRATGIKLDVAEAPAPDYPDGLRGKACRLTGKATGLTLRFDTIQDRIERALKGWAHDGAQDADGAFSARKVYASGAKRLAYSLEKEPPKGTCTANRPIVDCKVPARRWIWDFSVAAYRQ